MKNLIKSVAYVLVAPRRWWIRLLSAFCLLGGAVVCFEKGLHEGLSATTVAWCAVFTAYLLLRGFTWFRWYPRSIPRSGIEDHFDKASVVGVWLGALSGISAYGLQSSWPLFVAVPILLFFIVCNFVLVWFHVRDVDPSAPNFLSGKSRVF